MTACLTTYRFNGNDKAAIIVFGVPLVQAVQAT